MVGIIIWITGALLITSHRAWHRVTLKRQENESYSFERDRTGLS